MGAQTYKKHSPTYIGILFDGTNAREVAAFINDVGRSYDMVAHEARAGGGWIKYFFGSSNVAPQVESYGDMGTITKGCWVLKEHPSPNLKLVDEEVLRDQFRSIKSKKLGFSDTLFAAFRKKTAEKVEAIQLVKGSASDVAHFLRTKDRVVRVGGTWVSFSGRTARLSDWVVYDQGTGGCYIVSDEEFSGKYLQKS